MIRWVAINTLVAIHTLVAVIVLVALGCEPPSEVDSNATAISRPGPWTIPASTRTIADAQRVTYDGAGAWRGEAGCSGGPLPGTTEVGFFLRSAFPQISGIGGYSCRPNTADTSRTSVHGTGRAMDIFIPLHSGDADNDLGDEVANWLIEHTAEIGVQYVIWDRWQWNGSRSAGNKDRSYGGPHPHHDHLHVELTLDAGNRRTPWFSGPMAPPAETPSIPGTCDAGTAYTPQFCDDDGHWAEGAIQYLFDNALTFGCGEINGKPRFCPDDPATRGQAIVFIGRASEMPTAGHPNAFDDDAGHFAEAYLNAAAAFGIIRGCAERMACPNDPATRSQVAVFLARTYNLPAATRDHFDDDAGSMFEADHNRLAESGITTGCGPRRFCGSEVVTRAMMAAFIQRVHSRGLPTVWAPMAPDVPPAMDDDPGPEEPADAGASDAATDASVGSDGGMSDAGSIGEAGPGEAGPGDAGFRDEGLESGCSLSPGAGHQAAWPLLAVILLGLRGRRRTCRSRDVGHG